MVHVQFGARRVGILEHKSPFEKSRVCGTRILRAIHGRVEHPSGAAPPGTPHARATFNYSPTVLARSFSQWQHVAQCLVRMEID